MRSSYEERAAIDHSLYNIELNQALVEFLTYHSPPHGMSVLLLDISIAQLNGAQVQGAA